MCCEGLIEKFPQLDNCCFCCKIETGSKVIAWLGAVGALIYSIFVLSGIVAVAMGAPVTNDSDKHEAFVTITIIVLVILLIFLVGVWAMAIILLIGLYKEDMSKVRLWLRVNICLFIFGAVGMILNNIMLIAGNSGKSAGAIVASIISGIFQILISLYMIAVVKSHYYNKTQGFENVRA